MKTQRLIKLLSAPAVALFLAANAGSQSAVDWFTLDGGGGASSGSGAFGSFAVVGTIGQPDAGPALSGGGYSVTGGFWSFLGGGTDSSAPMLRIWLAGTHAVIAWPNPSTGFELQESPTLGAPANPWNNVSQTPTVVGAERQVTVPATGGRFYRLRKP